MPECIDSATSLDGGCYDGTAAPECIYCGPTDYPDNMPCQLMTGYGGEVTLCNTSGIPLQNWDYSRPTLQLQYQDGYQDAEGSTVPFGNTVAHRPFWRPYLRATTKLMVQPCQTYQYCGAGAWFASWLCRWTTWNENGQTGWAVYCNRPEYNEPPAGAPYPDQLVTKDFEVDIGVSDSLRPPVFVTFHWSDVQCFTPFENLYCMSTGCEDEGEDRWNCLAEESGSSDKLAALDQIYLVCDAAINDTDVEEGETYPHRNRDDIDVKVACWDECNEHFDGLLDDDTVNVMHGGPDEPPGWDSATKGGFNTQVDFGNRVVTTLNDDDETIPLAITLWEPHLDLSVPAELTLNECVGSYSINSEARLYDGTDIKRNVYVAAWLRLSVRPKITAAGYAALAAAGHATMDPGDSYEIRFAHPLQSGQEHPNLQFIARGPEGGIIPGKMEWRGLKIADDDEDFRAYDDDGCEADWTGSCCEMLREIHRVAVPSQFNDFSSEEESDQLYQGAIGFRVRPIIHETVCECV